MDPSRMDAMQHRLGTITRRDPAMRAAGEAATFEIAVSTETPVERWFGIEILSHDQGAVDMSRLKRGAAVLVDHGGDQVGVVESARIDPDKVLRAEIRFSRNARGQEVERDVADGIRQNVSVGYFVKATKLSETRGDGTDVYTVTRWTPAEVSIVSVPADIHAGVGRSVNTNTTTNSSTTVHTFEVTMSEQNAEQKRAQDIRGLCKTAGFEDRAADYINSTLSIAEIAGRLSEARATRGVAQPSAESLQLDALSERDRSRYSYSRAILVAAGYEEGGLETEVAQEMERQRPADAKRHGGVLVPLDLRSREDRWRMSQRTLTSVARPGTELVFEQAGDLIELLRNRTLVIQAGARVLSGLSAPVSFPKQTASATLYTVPENPGTDVPSSDPLFGLVSLNPKTAMGNVQFSRQWLVQVGGSFDGEAIVRADLTACHSVLIDRLALHGTGNTGQPTGVYLAPGVGSVPFGSAPPTLATLSSMVASPAIASADVESMKWITTPSLASKMSQTLVASSAGSDMLWSGKLAAGEVRGYTAYSTANASATMSGSQPDGGTAHALLFGDWSQLYIGLFGGLELIADPLTLKRKGLIEITSFQMFDIAVRHGESFVKATAATTS